MVSVSLIICSWDYARKSEKANESNNDVYGDHFVNENVTVKRGMETLKTKSIKENISTLFVDFYQRRGIGILGEPGKYFGDMTGCAARRWSLNDNA